VLIVAEQPLAGSRPVLIISPHLDDAVLSCGQLINSRPGTLVTTVLAGFPPGAHAGWSAQTTGLPVAEDANSMRRDEDQRATNALGARTEWIDFPAQEYGPNSSPSERILSIQQSIAAAVATSESDSIFLPLGLTHPDHIVVSDAALLAVHSAKVDSYVYMEMPYGQARPGRVRSRLRRIAREFNIEPLTPFVGDVQKKAEAVNAYSSQIETLQKGFGRHFGRVFTDPERYWRLRPLVES
jgi:LmbE family N-acetylglucosaminyl deacetylase